MVTIGQAIDALLSGNTVKLKLRNGFINTYIYKDNKVQVVFESGNTESSIRISQLIDAEVVEIMSALEWYDNLNGTLESSILCRHKSGTIIQAITKVPGIHAVKDPSGFGYDISNITPLSLEEVKKYIWQH